MRILLLAALMTLALVAAPAPVAVEPAAACAEEGCPVWVEKCRWPGGFRVWVLGEPWLNLCIYGP